MPGYNSNVHRIWVFADGVKTILHSSDLYKGTDNDNRMPGCPDVMQERIEKGMLAIKDITNQIGIISLCVYMISEQNKRFESLSVNIFLSALPS